MPTTTKVLASRFNTLVTRMNAILGTSNLLTPTFGYGQATTANTVVGNYNTNTTSTNLIDDAQYRSLYIDMVRARVHQIGSAAFTQSPFPVGSYNINGASTDKVTEAYIIALESLMTSIETDKFLIYEAQQAALEPLKNSGGFNLQGSRTQSAAGTWNQTLSFIFTVTFTSDAARRHFFNSGGQVRLAGQRVAGVSSNAKSTSWTNLLTSVGQVTFAVNRTYSTLAYGSGTSIGNKDLTGTYQQIYQGGSGIYSGNYVRVYALQNSGSQIQFRVYFEDIRSEGIDEPVYGDFNITTQILRPEGTVTISGNSYNTVTITPAPIGTIVTDITQI